MAATTRRQFLVGLSALSFAPLAGKVKPNRSGYINRKRAAEIDTWLAKLAEPIAALAEWGKLVEQAKGTAPEEVNADALYDAVEAIEAFSLELDTIEFGNLFETVTGQSLWAMYIEREILSGEAAKEPDFWRRELASLRKENRQEAKRLLALLNAHSGGVL